MYSLATIRQQTSDDLRLIYASATLEAVLKQVVGEAADAKASLGDLVGLRRAFLGEQTTRDVFFALGVRNAVAHGLDNSYSPADRQRAARHLVGAIEQHLPLVPTAMKRELGGAGATPSASTRQTPDTTSRASGSEPSSTPTSTASSPATSSPATPTSKKSKAGGSGKADHDRAGYALRTKRGKTAKPGKAAKSGTATKPRKVAKKVAKARKTPSPNRRATSTPRSEAATAPTNNVGGWLVLLSMVAAFVGAALWLQPSLLADGRNVVAEIMSATGERDFDDDNGGDTVAEFNGDSSGPSALAGSPREAGSATRDAEDGRREAGSALAPALDLRRSRRTPAIGAGRHSAAGAGSSSASSRQSSPNPSRDDPSQNEQRLPRGYRAIASGTERSPVVGLGFLHDGRLMLALQDGGVHFRTLGDEPSSMGWTFSETPLLFADVSRDGRTIVTGSAAHVGVWDTRPARRLQFDLANQNGTLSGVRLSPEGRFVAFALTRPNDESDRVPFGTLSAWHLEPSPVQRVHASMTAAYEAFDVSPQGLLATGSGFDYLALNDTLSTTAWDEENPLEYRAELIDPETGRDAADDRSDGPTFRSLIALPGGDVLASLSWRSPSRATRTEVARFRRRDSSSVERVWTTPNDAFVMLECGARIFCGRDDGVFWFFDPTSGRVLSHNRIEAPQPIQRYAISRDGHHLAIIDGTGALTTYQSRELDQVATRASHK